MTVFALLAGIAIGLVIGYLLQRGRVATAEERATARRRSTRSSSGHRPQAALMEGQLGERLDVGQLVGPIRETLARVEQQLRESDRPGPGRTPSSPQQVEFTGRGAEQLREQTQALVTALRRPEARGRWGELQLRRVVELAGMTARCDFDEQVTVAAAAGAAPGHGGPAGRRQEHRS